MLAKKITSLQHPNISHWIQLRKERAAREAARSLLISGERLIFELSQKISIKSLITLEPLEPTAAQDHFLVTEEILKKITGLQNPPPFAAEVELPAPQPIDPAKSILILDQLRDPGNLGTLIRTAAALGWGGVIATPGTVDFFNDKALRASRGAIFHLPYLWQTPEQIQEWAQKNQLPLFLGDIQGSCLDQTPAVAPCALILSNEARGPSHWTEKIARRITIPMDRSAESLNVASAGAILLHAMRPR